MDQTMDQQQHDRSMGGEIFNAICDRLSRPTEVEIASGNVRVSTDDHCVRMEHRGESIWLRSDEAQALADALGAAVHSLHAEEAAGEAFTTALGAHPDG
jgi:hypothetical protein